MASSQKDQMWFERAFVQGLLFVSGLFVVLHALWRTIRALRKYAAPEPEGHSLSAPAAVTTHSGSAELHSEDTTDSESEDIIQSGSEDIIESSADSVPSTQPNSSESSSFDSSALSDLEDDVTFAAQMYKAMDFVVQEDRREAFPRGAALRGRHR